MNANIEIKALPQNEMQLVKNILGELGEFKFDLPQILFSSFSVTALRLLKEYGPAYPRGLLLHEWEPDWEKFAQELDCMAIHVNEEILTVDYVQKIKKMDKLLLSYTVNDVKRARILFEMGVTAFFSDVPDVILKGLKDLNA